MIDLEISADDLKKAGERLAGIKDGIPRAMMRAINRTVKAAQTIEVKAVQDEADIPPKKIKATISFKYARLADLNGETVSKGYRLPLIYFDPKPKQVTKKRPAGGVSAVTSKRRGRETFEGSFIGHWPKGARNVLERSGAERFPIQIVRGPSVPEVLEERGVSETVERVARERLILRFNHEVNFLLKEAAKRFST